MKKVTPLGKLIDDYSKGGVWTITYEGRPNVRKTYVGSVRKHDTDSFIIILTYIVSTGKTMSTREKHLRIEHIQSIDITKE